MKVDYVLRSDSVQKRGGDNVQVEAYSAELAKLGVDTRLIPFSPNMDLRRDALVHVVNIDRPYDFLRAVRGVSRERLIVSPIHHSLDAVASMRKAESGQGIRTIAGRLPESAREFLAYGARTWISGHSPLATAGAVVSAARQSRDVWRRAGRVLDEARFVCLLAVGEGRHLRDDLGWRALNGVLVPNGLPPVHTAPVQWADRDRSALVVGRVEPRKRQLEVAKAASESGLEITFVGEGSQNSRQYVQEFAAVVERSPRLRWLGAVPHDEVQRLMANARVLLNMSWVEVQSLVDIEAVTGGAFVVANSNGNSAEWLGSPVTTVDVDDLAGALAAAARLVNERTGPPPSVYRRTWTEAAQDLRDLYELMES